MKELIPTEKKGISLTDAKIVIGGGRGMGSAEAFKMLEELASLLHNAAVGATRVATNNNWRPHSDQIGQTGAQIAPDLYIACRISGQSAYGRLQELKENPGDQQRFRSADLPACRLWRHR